MERLRLLTANEIGSQLWDSIAVILSPAKLDGEIAALNESGLAQSFAEGPEGGSACCRCIGTQKSHDRH